MGVLSIEVVGGLTTLKFRPGCSTGREPDTNPGVGFDYVTSYSPMSRLDNGLFYGGTGVIGRADAAKLRDMLNEFLGEDY